MNRIRNEYCDHVKNVPGDYKKRKKRMEEQRKLSKLPKEMSYFSNIVPGENKNELIINGVNIEVNIKSSAELSTTANETSGVLTPEILPCFHFKVRIAIKKKGKGILCPNLKNKGSAGFVCHKH